MNVPTSLHGQLAGCTLTSVDQQRLEYMSSAHDSVPLYESGLIRRFSLPQFVPPPVSLVHLLHSLERPVELRNVGS